MERIKSILLVCSMICVCASHVSYADPGDKKVVEEQGTFTPKVTALRSLNAYLSTDKDLSVYYIPTLEELPDIKNAAAECEDYMGNKQRFAVVYDGYFNSMCYAAMTKSPDGSYVNTPKGVSIKRELNTLGYDYLLRSEKIANITPITDDISADYKADLVGSGYVDLSTALMDIYKAIGREKLDITYAFSPDTRINVENSPLQSEINLALGNDTLTDMSAGMGWVFTTRTNPDLYWRQAVSDGLVSPVDSKVAKEKEVSLAEFCDYAYSLMDMYGEPVMTQSEKNILLQFYGVSVPYRSATDSQVTAIEYFIAKGIISPDDDAQYLKYGNSIDFNYMLTLLMRIKDNSSRKTYKDVKITMDANLMAKNYYSAPLTMNTSNIIGFKESMSAARATSYYDYMVSSDELQSMAESLGISDRIDFYITTHLAVVNSEGIVYPLTTEVTTQSNRIKDPNTTSSTEDAIPFCINEGVVDNMIHLRIVAFDVQELMSENSTYTFVLVDDKGNKSPKTFEVKPGGGIYYTSGVSSVEDKDSDTQYSEEFKSIVRDLYNTYRTEGSDAAEALFDKYYGENDWTDEQVDKALSAARRGIPLASSENYVFMMQIKSGTESSIVVTTKTGSTIKLSDIMINAEKDGMHYANPMDTTDFAFYKVSSTLYQIYNCPGERQLNERIRSASTSDTVTAFCQKEKELLVSSSWLVSSGTLSRKPIVVKDDAILMLPTDYSNVYLDKVNKYIVVGACVYDVSGLDESEIWAKVGDDIYVNFRAVLGWTGDFMIFKNEGGSISVNVTRSNTVNGANNPINGPGAKSHSIPIHLMDTDKYSGNTVNIQGYLGSKGDTIPMTSMYPFGNYLVYISPEVLDDTEAYHDWLFVFKPRQVKVNGKMVVYDDTVSRNYLHQLLRVKLGGLDNGITVWAYPLYRKSGQGHGGMPDEMRYDEKYGYMYTPSSDGQSIGTIMANYYNIDAVSGSNSSKPKFALPFYTDSNGKIRCFNVNVFTYENDKGETVMLDYGNVPVNTTGILSMKGIYSFIKSLSNPGIDRKDLKLSSCASIPAITSPALWLLELQRYKSTEVYAASNKGSQLYWGTCPASLSKIGNKYTLSIGSLVLSKSTDSLNYMLMRETALSDTGVGKWFSASAYNAFKLESIIEDGKGTTVKIEGPKIGETRTTVDVIDWNRWTTSRILENTEVVIAIGLILLLNLAPRVAISAFIILIGLGYIQNIGFVQKLCDKYIDPYKILTLGSQDVHTFRRGKMFIMSICGAGVYGALFYDGNIILILEWIMSAFGHVTQIL